MPIYTPTNSHNWINRLKDYIHKRKHNPVQAVNPMTVNMDREVRRMQERMMKEREARRIEKR